MLMRMPISGRNCPIARALTAAAAPWISAPFLWMHLTKKSDERQFDSVEWMGKLWQRDFHCRANVHVDVTGIHSSQLPCQKKGWRAVGLWLTDGLMDMAGQTDERTHLLQRAKRFWGCPGTDLVKIMAEISAVVQCSAMHCSSVSFVVQRAREAIKLNSFCKSVYLHIKFISLTFLRNVFKAGSWLCRPTISEYPSSIITTPLTD